MVHCVERRGGSRFAVEHAASGALEGEETRAHSSLLLAEYTRRAAELITDCSRFS